MILHEHELEDKLARITRNTFWCRLMIVLGVYLLLILVSLILPSRENLNYSLRAPSWEYILGTDVLGRDIVYRILLAFRYSILLSVGTVSATACVGTFIGVLTAGNSFLSKIIHHLTSIIIVVPLMVVCALLIARWGGETRVLVLAQFFAFVPLFVRLSSKEISLTMENEYAQIAMSLGNSYIKISFRHAILEFIPKLIAQMLSLLVVSIGIENGLSYLGIGPPLPHTSFGVLINDSIRYWDTMPWYPLSIMFVFILFISSVSWVTNAKNKK